MTPSPFTIPASRINHLRRAAATVARIPEETPQGWSKSRVDPARVLAIFNALRLKPGFTLAAYQFRARDNGNGVVWALPADADYPEPDRCPRGGGFLEAPEPAAALEDVMEAVDGDDTPWSYLRASIVSRELREFGAMWHGCHWSEHTILGSDPTRRRSRMTHTPATGWEWSGPRPTEWKPQILIGKDAVKVVFFTRCQLEQERIICHTDTFLPGQYRFSTEKTTLATGQGGFVF